MSPFAGNGANLALMDAWDLASCLKSAASLDEALKAYDAIAVPRAQGVLTISRWSIDIGHASGWKLLLYKFVLHIASFLGSLHV